MIHAKVHASAYSIDRGHRFQSIVDDGGGFGGERRRFLQVSTMSLWPLQQNTQNEGRPPTVSVQASMDRITLLCMDSTAKPALGSLGILPTKFLGFVQLAALRTLLKQF